MEKKETTERTLLDTYLDYHNLTLRSTTSQEPKRDGALFMPMLMMDAMNIIYDDYVAPLPLKHREKMMRARWYEAYSRYMHYEFSAFNDDQKFEICNLMDDFEAHIHNDIEIFRTTVMGKFMEYDTDIRLALSAMLSCNVLAQGAQILYKAHRLSPNAYIDSVEAWSLKLLNEYVGDKIDRTTTRVNLNHFSDLNIASRKICDSVISFATNLKM